MGNTTKILLAVIAILIALSCLQTCRVSQLQHDNFELKNAPHTSDTIRTNSYDSTEHDVPVTYFLPGDSIRVEVPANVDTAAILQCYFNKYVYSQTVSDSNLVATIVDTICQNKIAARGFTYKWLQPVKQETIINNTTINEPIYRGVFAGLELGYINKAVPSVCPGIKYMDRKQRLYGVSSNLLQAQPNFQLSFYLKLNARNKTK